MTLYYTYILDGRLLCVNVGLWN